MEPLTVLQKYPEWKAIVDGAAVLPPLPLNYSPGIIEIFDQYGLLAGSFFGWVYELERSKEESIDFVAWCLDGDLALFYSGSEVLVNRLKGKMTIYQGITGVNKHE